MRPPTPVPEQFPPPVVSSGWRIPEGFRVVGYFPGWSGDVANLRYQALTHINYAFALVDATGTFRPLDSPEKLRDLVTRSKEWGVRVLLSVGGWNEGSTLAFDKIASDPARTRAFVEGAVRLLYTYALDGVDLDWEYPRAGTSSGYTTVVLALAEALHARGWDLSLAVSAADVNGQFISDQAWQAADWINVMAYDDGWASPPSTLHSTYEFARSSLDYWIDRRGVPRHKAVLGVPFYGRSLVDSSPRTYRALLEAFPGAEGSDVAGGFGYNGPDTLRAKVVNQARLRAGGVMVWQLNQDARGPSSLLSLIYDTVKEPLP